MIATHDLDEIEARLLASLRAKLRVRAKTLQAGMKRAGRLLPRDAHRAAQVLIQARREIGHPKLAKLIDPQSLSAAERAIQSHLDKIDPKERRKDAWLSFAGTQAMNVLAVVGLVVGLMLWRGLL